MTWKPPSAWLQEILAAESELAAGHALMAALEQVREAILFCAYEQDSGFRIVAAVDIEALNLETGQVEPLPTKDL